MNFQILMPTNGVYHTIPTHKKPHIEEIGSLVLLEDYGTNIPGLATAKVDFWDAGYETPQNQTWEELMLQGIFPSLGCGGSFLDEHPNPSRPRIEGKCSMNLVAELLGLDQELWLEKVLKYCTTNDLKGATHPYEPGNLIKLINDEWFDKDPQYALQLSKQVVRVMINDQIRFFELCGKAYDNCSVVHEGFHKEKKLTVVSMITDDTNMPKYARSSYGDKAHVVIKKDSLGHIYISTSKRWQIYLGDVISLLRAEEIRIKSGKPVFMKRDQLESEGTVEGIEEWHYEPTHGAIFNGTKTATEKPVTKIPFEQIVEIVLLGLNELTYFPNYFRNCRKGKCIGALCPMYTAKLERCKVA